MFNCSHIDISLENDFLLYNILNEKNKIDLLINFFDTLENISEIYFVDLNKSPNCYSDMICRGFSKEYDEFEFSNLLLKDREFTNKLDEKTIKALGYNFTTRIFQEENFPLIKKLISENNLNVTCSVGSLTFYGEDVSIFTNLVREKLDDYIQRIIKKDIYKDEFSNVFKKRH